MENKTSTTYKKASPMVIGVLSIVFVLSVGAALGIVTGVVNVPFALADGCCGGGTPLPPPPVIPPIIVVPAPVCTLHATPASSPTGQATLSWTTVSAVSATIDQGVGSVNINGSSTSIPQPSATTKYTMTVVGPGGEGTCSDTITVTAPPPPAVPVCMLTVSPTTYAATTAHPSIEPTVSWTTQNATSITIDNGLAAIPTGLVASGSQTAPAITTTTTYTGTATGPGGTSAPCTATITVTPPPPPPGAPVCTLTVSPTTYDATTAKPSIKPTLSWTTQNATTFTLDNGIGSKTPVSSGSFLAPAITTTTTYTGTATGPGGTSAPCTATITVTPPPPPPGAPVCTLTATPTSFVDSGAPKLSWTTTNATGFSLDNAIGAVPAGDVAAGSTTAPTITSDTTYTGTATGPGGTSAPCTVTVTVTSTPPPPTLACTLSADPAVLPIGGGTTVLSWTTLGAFSFSIDNNVGEIASTSSSFLVGSTTSGNVTSSTVFTGTVTSASGATATCTAPVSVQTGGGGGGGCTGSCCSGGCGGGGGGGGHPNVTLSVLKQPGPQPLAFVYLSEIPYTGLDLGLVGTVMYWVALVAWSLAAAYLALFIFLPYLAKRVQRFGAEVQSALNTREAFETVTSDAQIGAQTTYTPQTVPEMPSMPSFSSRGYSTYDGFRSFAKEGALSIEDIVGGLAREAAPKVEPVYEKVEPIYNTVEQIQERVEPIQRESNAQDTRATRAPQAEAAPIAPEVPSFLEALINGEREVAFSALRAVVRAGGDAEAFLTQVVCALDDAYRARLDGTAVHPEVASITKDCATPFLERLITSLSTAVDSSYSTGITGAKLALTRAFAVTGA